MTKIILFIGSLFVVVNTIVGLLLSKYLLFNWLSVDVVLIINTIIIYKLSSDNISNGLQQHNSLRVGKKYHSSMDLANYEKYAADDRAAGMLHSLFWFLVYEYMFR